MFYGEDGKMYIEATCSCCGETEQMELTTEEAETLMEYTMIGRQMGMIQNLFPRIPAWIRSGAIDQYSGGFCICPKCS